MDSKSWLFEIFASPLAFDYIYSMILYMNVGSSPCPTTSMSPCPATIVILKYYNLILAWLCIFSMVKWHVIEYAYKNFHVSWLLFSLLCNSFVYRVNNLFIIRGIKGINFKFFSILCKVWKWLVMVQRIIFACLPWFVVVVSLCL